MTEIGAYGLPLRVVQKLGNDAMKLERDQDIMKYFLLSKFPGLLEVYFGTKPYKIFYQGHPADLVYIDFSAGVLHFEMKNNQTEFSMHFDTLVAELGEQLKIELSN